MESMRASNAGGDDTSLSCVCGTFETRGSADVAVGQNQWYHFGVGAPPILVYCSGDGDVHCGYGIVTHGRVTATYQSR